MRDIRRHRQIDIGHHALMQQERIGRKPLQPPSRGAVDHRFDALAALGRKLDDPAHNAHGAAHAKHEPDTLHQVG